MPNTGITVPWNAWYGDIELPLAFPDDWQVIVAPMRDAPDLGDDRLARAFEQPIGTPRLRDLACGRRDAIIAVDDITRPTPGARILPHILGELADAGIARDRIKIIIALGLHRPHLRVENLMKLGPQVVDEYEILHHYPLGKKLAFLGNTSWGTPVHINRYFVEADVKIGVGCVIPHSSAGYAGGGKIVLPGLAGLETIEINHRPAEAGETGGVGIVEGNQFRLEVEEAAAMAGLEFIANVVVNSRRGIAGIFVGHPVAAHREGCRLARQVYGTSHVPENVDIAFLNAYPKDQNLVNQSINAFDILLSTSKTIVRPGGAIVLMGACPEGPGFDRGHDHFLRLVDYGEYREAAEGRQMMVFSPNVSPIDARNCIREDCLSYQHWDALIAALHAQYGPGARVAVFPSATMQVDAQ